MSLKVQQSIVFSSPSILNNEKLQALIEGITPEGIMLTVPWGNMDIAQGTEIKISFWDEHATYEFKSKAVATKPAASSSLLVAKPTSLAKVINRSFQRVEINLKADAGPFDDIKKEPCLLIDISAGGAFMQGQSIYKANDLIKLTFKLPDGELYENIVAKVVWKKETGEGIANFGLQFESLSSIRRQKLLNFSETNAKK